MKVLFTGGNFNDEIANELRAHDITVETGRSDYSEDELADKLQQYDAYINGGDEICTRKVIESNQHLKLISFMGTGYQKYIDVDAARDCNIPVSFAPGANAKAVAEYTAALILDAVKKVSLSNAATKNGTWEKYETFNLEGKTLGIVGMGNIGQIIAKIMCDGFGMKLIYNSRSNKQDIDSRYNTRMVSLDELFEQSDVVSINATYTPENRDMISKAQLSKAKDGLILVNTARQELVNEDDLYDAVVSGRISCVAMDGFWTEPVPESGKRFLDLPNDKLIITPHNAYNSSDAALAVERMLADSLIDVQSGASVRHAVSE